MKAYANQLARINLSNQQVTKEPLDFEIVQEYLGGRGYAVKLLYEELAPKIDPLGPDNKFVLMTGPLTGSTSPTTSRYCVVYKSPLTNTLNDSHCGGNLGVELKKSGYDGLILEGRAENPCYILITDDQISIEDASDLWGKDINETTETLSARHPKYSIATIGQAGENLVKFACLANQHRFAGRGGSGAVLGSKNVKALVIKGSGKITVANEYAFKTLNRKFIETLNGHPVTGGAMVRYGTPVLSTSVNKSGVFPVKNFQEGIFPNIRDVAAETLRDLMSTRKGCRGCPIGCGRSFEFEDVNAFLEYESLWALGVNCNIHNIRTILQASKLCNAYGLDTISAGNVIGWFMECGEKGLVADAPKFGDEKALLALLEKIAMRSDEGNMLADGVKLAADQVGKGSQKFACHVKGLELPAYDPRGLKGMALSYVTASSGGTHLKAYTVVQEILSLPHYVNPLSEEGKVDLVKRMQDVFAVIDSAEWCKFTSLAMFSTLACEIDLYAKILTTATGFFIDSEEFYKIGERIYNIERLFNHREGFTADDDVLPDRFLTETLPEGPAKGQTADTTELLKAYYHLRGWDAQGVPSDRKLEELNIAPIESHAKLQVALDLRDMDEAIRIAKAAVAGGVDWLECGTPLVKSVGMDIVRNLRELFPDKTIVCDLKTMDTGFLESEMAALAGSDIVCILGVAPDGTIKDAAGARKKFGIKIHVDLINSPDPIQRAIEAEKLGADYIGLHIGIDQQMRSGYDKVPYPTLKKLKESVNIPVCVAGGLNETTIPKAIECGADVLIVGGAITRSANPEEATRRLMDIIKKSKKA